MQEVGGEEKAGPKDFVFWSQPTARGRAVLRGGWGEGEPVASTVGPRPELPSVPRAAGLAGAEEVKGRFLSEPRRMARAPLKGAGGQACTAQMRQT